MIRTLLRLPIVTALLLPACFSWTGAQTMSGAAAPTRESLSRDYNAGTWQEFVAGVEVLRAHSPDAIPPILWFRLGTAQLNLKHYDSALEAFDAAGAAGFNAAFVALSQASTHAEQGHKDAAFAALDRAVQAGYSNTMVVNNNARLQALRSDARYQDVLDKMQAAHPCSRPECRLFDFWVGEWDVHGPNGSKAGTNSIQPMLNRCVLQEKWLGASGGGGQSINFYHPGKKKWVQIWNDASGGVIEIEGEYHDGAMRFTGRNTAADGSFEVCRATWTLLDDGRVRQFWEQSKDEGTTWYTWFDGYYTRRE